MQTPSHDVLIIGGGPGGSSAALALGRAGRRVLLLEKDYFPRFHIGESLLPCNRSLLRDLGVLPAVEAAGFPVKRGATFELADGSRSTRFVFRPGRFARETSIVQVERARFDHLLLQQVRACGVDAREGWTVKRHRVGARSVAVTAAGPDGRDQRFEAAFLVDASGRANLTGNQEGLREIHPRHRKVALFGHFHGVARDAGEAAGDTVIVRFRNNWFWLIPIGADKTSVGLVMDRDEFAAAGGEAEAIFQRWARSSPVLQRRLAGASPLGPVQVTADFSYFNRRFTGPRLARVGDAAGFMDPIFSGGVYLAMHSGALIAQVMDSALRRGDAGAPDLARYERRLRAAMRTYWRMVEAFYTVPFTELLLQPRDVLSLGSAVTAVLAGHFEWSWALRWRMELFFRLVRLQAVWPVVPPLALLRAEQGSPPTPGGA